MTEEEEQQNQNFITVGNHEGPLNEKGEYEGRARHTYANRDQFVGVYSSGIREGFGTYRWAFLGCKYRGEYKNGQRDGKGQMFYTNGCFYDGEWMNGRRHGMGRMEYPNLDIYEGEWTNGVRQGKGKYFYFSCGSWVEGDFQNDRVVSGVLKLKDGSQWAGEFRLGQPFGKGEWTVAGWKQSGQFVEVQQTEQIKDEETCKHDPEDIEYSINDEAEGDQANWQKLKEDKEKEEAGEGAKEEGEEAKEKVDPREVQLRKLQPPKRGRHVLLPMYDEKPEMMRTLKVKWLPDGLPEKVK